LDLLSEKYRNDGKSAAELNKVQMAAKAQIERKIAGGIYPFEEVLCCVCDGNNSSYSQRKTVMACTPRLLFAVNEGLSR